MECKGPPDRHCLIEWTVVFIIYDWVYGKKPSVPRPFVWALLAYSKHWHVSSPENYAGLSFLFTNTFLSKKRALILKYHLVIHLLVWGNCAP